MGKISARSQTNNNSLKMKIIYSNYYDEHVNDDEFGYIELINTLDVKLPARVIAIASLGLWNGRKQGYKILLPNMLSIFSCWDSCEFVKLFISGANVKGVGSHHDGTNYVTFKMLNSDSTLDSINKLKSAIYSDSADQYGLIKRHTRCLGKYLKHII